MDVGGIEAFCGSCGEPTRIGRAYCTACGAKYDAEPVAPSAPVPTQSRSSSSPVSTEGDGPIPLRRWLFVGAVGAAVYLAVSIALASVIQGSGVVGVVVGAAVAGLVLPARKPMHWVLAGAATLLGSLLVTGLFAAVVLLAVR